MRYCKDCWNFDRCNVERKTVDFAVDDGVCLRFDGKPMTNADRIRAMTDVELAAFMFSMVDCVSCENKLMNNGKLVFGDKRKTCTDKDYHAMCNGDGRKCEAVCLEWLQQPAEGD